MKWKYGTTEVVLSCLGKGLLIRQKRENRMAKKAELFAKVGDGMRG